MAVILGKLHGYKKLSKGFVNGLLHVTFITLKIGERLVVFFKSCEVKWNFRPMILALFRAMLEGLAMIFYYYTSKTVHFYVNLIMIFFIKNSRLADVTIEAQVKLQMCSYLY